MRHSSKFDSISSTNDIDSLFFFYKCINKKNDIDSQFVSALSPRGPPQSEIRPGMWWPWDFPILHDTLTTNKLDISRKKQSNFLKTSSQINNAVVAMASRELGFTMVAMTPINRSHLLLPAPSSFIFCTSNPLINHPTRVGHRVSTIDWNRD